MSRSGDLESTFELPCGVNFGVARGLRDVREFCMDRIRFRYCCFSNLELLPFRSCCCFSLICVNVPLFVFAARVMRRSSVFGAGSSKWLSRSHMLLRSSRKKSRSSSYVILSCRVRPSLSSLSRTCTKRGGRERVVHVWCTNTTERMCQSVSQ